MSIDRKILIGAGAFLLVIMSSIAAFSLGVYVGENGWTENPASMLTRNTGQRSARQPQPSNVPNGKPALTGLLIGKEENTLTLQAKEGPRQVLLKDETRVMRWDGTEMGLSDLQRGMPLAVFGRFDPDERILRADVLVLLPPPQEKDKGV